MTIEPFGLAPLDAELAGDEQADGEQSTEEHTGLGWLGSGLEAR